MLKKRSSMNGNSAYIYPGMLRENEEIINGGDFEEDYKKIMFKQSDPDKWQK